MAMGAFPPPLLSPSIPPMRVSAILAICTLHLAVAASRTPSSVRQLPASFIPAPTHHDHLRIKADVPLLIRGGQQVTSKSRKGHFDVSVFGWSSYTQYNSVLAAVNLLGLGISLTLPRIQYHLDLLGTGAFALASILTAASGFAEMSLRAQMSTLAVALWSIKLAVFLFYRACKVKKDARLEGLLSTTSGAVAFWIMSFLWGVISSLPHSLGLSSASPGNQSALLTGALIYIAGLATETLADYQKWVWKQNNPGKFCNGGLWSISQHPNFFGNLLIWSGITVMNVPALIEPIANDGTMIANVSTSLWAYHKAFLALLSPVFLWTFFNGQANGSIGSAVEESIKRYGDDINFNEYVNEVPLIVPGFRSKGL